MVIKSGFIVCRCSVKRYKAHPPWLQSQNRQVSYHPLLSARTRLLCLCAASDRERNRIKRGIIPDYPPWCSVCIFPQAARFFQFLSSALIPANFLGFVSLDLPSHPYHPPSPPQELRLGSCGVLLCSIFASSAILNSKNCITVNSVSWNRAKSVIFYYSIQ